MVRWLFTLQTRLASVPSLVYAAIYIGAIVMFAITYANLAHGFVHTTMTRDAALDHLRNKLATSLKADARRWIASNLTLTAGCVDTANSGELAIASVSELPELWGTGPSTRISLRMGIGAYDCLTRRQGAEVDWLDWLFEHQDTQSTHYGRPYGRPEGHMQAVACSVFTRMHDSSFDNDLLPAAMYKLRRCEFQLSEATVVLMEGYRAALRGFPYETDVNWSGAFYLSIETITTLGYGDIVPVEDVARTLVSAEALLGVLTIGLFLNSLSREGRSYPPKEQP